MMFRHKAGKLVIALVLLLMLLGTAAIGPHKAAAGHTFAPQQYQRLACGSIQLPPCG